MAIDTRDKRASASSLVAAWLLSLPSPGTIDQPDRQHLACCYRGIAASGPPAGLSAYPDPFAATSTTTVNPFAATTTSTVNPFAATSRPKGS